MTNLPKGYYSCNDNWSTEDKNWFGYNSEDRTKVCTCGCWTTYGKDCDQDYHSDWCDLVRKKSDTPQ